MCGGGIGGAFIFSRVYAGVVSVRPGNHPRCGALMVGGHLTYPDALKVSLASILARSRAIVWLRRQTYHATLGPCHEVPTW